MSIITRSSSTTSDTFWGSRRFRGSISGGRKSQSKRRKWLLLEWVNRAGLPCARYHLSSSYAVKDFAIYYKGRLWLPLRRRMNNELNFSPKLWEARSRLYRRRVLQVNIRWKALDETYKIYILLHRSDLKISANYSLLFIIIHSCP